MYTPSRPLPDIIMFSSSSTSLKKLQRSRNLTDRLDRMAFTSRSSTANPPQSLLQTLIQRQQRDNKLKSQAHTLQLQLQVKRKQNQQLCKNVESALQIAKKQRVQWSRGKQQVALMSTMQTRQNRLVQKLTNRAAELEEQLRKVVNEREQLTERCALIQIKEQEIVKAKEEMDRLGAEYQGLQRINEGLKTGVEDNRNLKERIKALEFNIREIRLINEECNNTVKKVNHQKKLLEEALKKTKPDAERQQERIRYYERVNLDMQRKMDDFNRRENQLQRQIERLTRELNSTKASRDNYKAKLQATTKNLADKTTECEDFTSKYHQKCQDFDQLTKQHEQSVRSNEQLSKKLQDTIQFYSEQSKQNIILLQRNKALQQNQNHIRDTLAHIKVITYEVNVQLTKKESQNQRLKKQCQSLTEKLKQLTQMFSKFDAIYNQGTLKGHTQLRETVHGYIRINKKLQLDLQDIKNQLDQKFLLFGQERDSLKRDLELRKLVLPSDETCYHAIFADKNQEMRVLENSNLQLLKIKAGLEETVEEASKRLNAIQRENDAFKIRVLDLYKLTKEHEELKEREQRYHNMLIEAREEKEHLEEQMTALRQKNQKLYDQLFKVQMQNKTHTLTIANLNNILNQLDVQTLQAKKSLLQKRDLLMLDTIDKFINAVDSLNIYFNCSICNKLIKDPVTVVLCGHSYCWECTKGYEDECFDCNTGLPVERTFANKSLADAGTKYQFFLLVFGEVQRVFDRKPRK